MDIRPLTPRYAVAPQILPEDMPAVRAAGFATVICNRPDEENPPALQSPVMAEAARAAGLTFHMLPLTHQTMSAANMNAQADFIEASAGPVLAYCASGTRSSVIWSLGQAGGQLSVDEILATTACAGYPLDQLRPTLDALDAARR